MKQITNKISFLIIVSLTMLMGCTSEPGVSVSFDQTSKSLFKGETFSLQLQVSQSINSDEVTWACSNESVISISVQGLTVYVTALADGTANVTASYRNQTAICTINVNVTPDQNGSGENDGYSLVWEDLFDAEILNEEYWNIEVVSHPANSELQYYRRENVSTGTDSSCWRKCLILTAKKENYGSRSFTSGRVNTNGKVAYKHGKVDAMIRFPKTYKGLWPAFWMMGNDYSQVGWPRCGEIDIVEMGNSGGFQTVDKSERFLNGALHWGYYVDGNYPNYGKSSTYSYSVQDGNYHLFTLLWDENSVKMYIDLDKYPDAKAYYSMDITAPDPMPAEPTWDAGEYFHKDFFILFNLAVGGHFPGITKIDAITALNEENNYEAKMYIDYVKVYQKAD